MATQKKNRQSFEKIDRISLPIIYTEYTDNGKSVPIQPFRGKSSLSDSRRTSISSDISTFSSFKPDDFESDATSLKSQRSESVDSDIGSLSEALDLYGSSESLSSIVSQDITEDLEDEKISTNKSQFASIRKSIHGKSIRLAKKIAPPTVPTFNIDKNLSNILNSEKKKELHKAKQKPQDKILKGDIAKIKEAISTAKSKVDLKERYNSLLNQLGKVQTHFNHNKKLHPDLKEAITELRKERWASQTNILAIKMDKGKVKDNFLFTDKREIFSRKRDAAKSLLDSQQYKGEDKEILKGLHKLYSSLAKSSEKKPKEKSNLESAFKREFGSAYQKSCSTRLSEVSVSQPAPSLSK